MQINLCKHGKRGRTGQRCAPYGGAARAASKTAHRNPLPEPPNINTGSCNYRMLPNTATKKSDSLAAGKCRSAILNTAPYGGAVWAHRKFAHSTHLSDLTALTYNDHMLLDKEPNINLHTAPLPADAQLLTKTPWEERPDKTMRPRDDGGVIAGIRPPRDRLHAFLLHTSYSARTRKQKVAHHPKSQDNGKRQRSGRAPDCVSPPPPSNEETTPSPYS